MKAPRWVGRTVRWGLVLAAAATVLAIAGIAYLAGRIPSKALAPHATRAPSATGIAAEPIPQFESHTCGLLALSSAYATYGLSADDENLRFRLGVDRPANPLDGSTTGTLHPDLYRVLGQDGFVYRNLDPAAVDAVEELRRHLAGGDAALLLIVRPENGNLHWIMTDGWDDERRLRIVDSLAPTARTEPAADFVRRQVVSIVAIRPAEGRAAPPDPHADGLAEMERVRRRLAGR